MAKQDVDGCRPTTTTPVLPTSEATVLAQTLKALADPVRLQLVSLIAAHEGGEACVCDLTGPFDLSGPTISHHLKVLRTAGIVSSERRGTWVHYRLVPGVLGEVGLRLDALRTPPTLALVSAGGP